MALSRGYPPGVQRVIRYMIYGLIAVLVVWVAMLIFNITVSSVSHRAVPLTYIRIEGAFLQLFTIIVLIVLVIVTLITMFKSLKFRVPVSRMKR